MGGLVDRVAALWRQATTERDNSTSCPVRLGAVTTAAVYHAAAAWMVFGQGAAIDAPLLGAYVQHMATLIGVTAGGVGVKSALKGDAA